MSIIRAHEAWESEALDRTVRQIEDNIAHYERVGWNLGIAPEVIPALKNARDVVRGIRDSGCWIETGEDNGG